MRIELLHYCVSCFTMNVQYNCWWVISLLFLLLFRQIEYAGCFAIYRRSDLMVFLCWVFFFSFFSSIIFDSFKVELITSAMQLIHNLWREPFFFCSSLWKTKLDLKIISENRSISFRFDLNFTRFESIHINRNSSGCSKARTIHP